MIYDLQKASLSKRISAFIFDIILLCILAVGFAGIISNAVKYDDCNAILQKYYTSYEEKYNIKFNLSNEEQTSLSDDYAERYAEAEKALSEDTEAGSILKKLISLSLLITSLGIFCAYMILEFAVPLLLKNGQTVGKKIFGIAVMNTSGVKISSVSLFIRTILGKYTIETMVPVLIIIMIFFGMPGLWGTVVLCALTFFQITVVALSKKNLAIHDILAGTVAVDMSSQMIFNTDKEMKEYKARLASKNA